MRMQIAVSPVIAIGSFYSPYLAKDVNVPAASE